MHTKSNRNLALTISGLLLLTIELTGEVESEDVGAELCQVVQRLQMLLELTAGQLDLQHKRQVAKYMCIQR